MSKQESFTKQQPTLYLVATPIGNLGDMTKRALDTLEVVDLILAEDSRVSGKLLAHFDIKKPLMTYHDHNKNIKEQEILSLLKEGKNLALITDAGTPGISDPGYDIAKSCIESGFHVVSIPGASALLTALTSSGLLPQPFIFIGFLPRKKGAMLETLKSYQHLEATLVIYESPNRIESTVQTLYEQYGNRKVSFCRELTKAFETITRTDLETALTQPFDLRGEYVIILEGNVNKSLSLNELTVAKHVHYYVNQGLSEKEALKEVAKDRKLKKNEVYSIYKIKR